MCPDLTDGNISDLLPALICDAVDKHTGILAPQA
jgi:hypothetical protein